MEISNYNYDDTFDDTFLKKVVNILNLNQNFKFNKNNIGINIKLNSSQYVLLKKLCEDNKRKRIYYNNLNKTNEKLKQISHYNIDWPYQVLRNFFNINLQN